MRNESTLTGLALIVAFTQGFTLGWISRLRWSRYLQVAQLVLSQKLGVLTPQYDKMACLAMLLECV